MHAECHTAADGQKSIQYHCCHMPGNANWAVRHLQRQHKLSCGVAQGIVNHLRRDLLKEKAISARPSSSVVLHTADRQDKEAEDDV